VHREDRAHRDRDGRVRPGQGRFRRAHEGVLGNHDPTTPNRQGNDVGTQYRSAIFTTTEAQLAAAEDSRDRYQTALTGARYGTISTQIAPAKEAGDGVFYYAEDYHQGYLHKHPGGYCNHGFCQIGYDLAAHGQGVARAVLPES